MFKLLSILLLLSTYTTNHNEIMLILNYNSNLNILNVQLFKILNIKRL